MMGQSAHVIAACLSTRPAVLLLMRIAHVALGLTSDVQQYSLDGPYSSFPRRASVVKSLMEHCDALYDKGR